ncbi:COP1-interacting protein 7 [Syzygium oleosum]|uniref:COP1-interacting protein 7 n=1 Tax=Syzygium oleosum TaxID=219896 RepID=UPI0024B8AA19|nr:COP1-interacting protein 7 [Syzygium oleosum]
MDSGTRLDYAVFHLTPTRTRCDLVIFCGGTQEKLASGLFQPFVSHLNFVKDEISKGGYSITLRPPAKDLSWFTKSTFERFVRFVSTPEILERFIGLEKEIIQIESSLEAYDLDIAHVAGQGDGGSPPAVNLSITKLPDSSKLQSETAEVNDLPQEENSRLRLQHVLESRKAMLLKSQAMAYARGRAAGFDMDDMDELISFADAFGASRLREACLEFKKLCEKKQADVPWMEELSAMEAYVSSNLSFPATSGIMLANEMSAPSQGITLHYPSGDGSNDTVAANGFSGESNVENGKDDNVPQTPSAKAQMHIPWPHQIPPYMYQQMPPYPGYPFPVMQSVLPNNPNGNNQWPFNSEASYPDMKQEKKNGSKSSSERKKKTSHKEEAEYSEEEIHSGDSYSGDDSGESNSTSQRERRHSSAGSTNHRKHKKKSSRTVVIRNINYISSKRKGGDPDGDSAEYSSIEDELIDEDTLKQSVEDVVESLKKNRKTKRHTHRKKDSDDQILGNSTVDAEDKDREDNQSSLGHKTNDNWGAFQTLLMTSTDETDQPSHTLDQQSMLRSFEDESSHMVKRTIKLGTEKVGMKLKASEDSLFATEDRRGMDDSVINSVDFGSVENLRPGLKRADCGDEVLLISGRTDEYGKMMNHTPAGDAETSLTRPRKGEDSFIANMGTLESGDATLKEMIFDGDYVLYKENQSLGRGRGKEDVVDDSIMIQSRPSVNEPYNEFHLTRDISMVAEFNSAVQRENGTLDTSEDRRDLSKSYEPDDLFMMLDRDSEVEPGKQSWSLDSAVDITLAEAERFSKKEACDSANDKSALDGDANSRNKEVKAKKEPAKDAKSKVVQRTIGRSRPDLTSKTRKPSSINRSTLQKSKSEKEEEIRKKMEEMMIQRQKRIAERTAASGLTSTGSKKSPADSKTAKTPTKVDKNKSPSTGREINKVNSQNRAVRV